MFLQNTFIKFLLVSTVSIMLFSCSANKKTTVNKKNNPVEAWFKSRAWATGLTLQPHPSTNKAEFYRQYNKNKAYWTSAFEFLKHHDLDTLQPGKYVVDGDNVFVSVTEAPSKELDKANWEAHKKYIDLQYVIKGKEKIGVAPIAAATVIKPYDAAKDVANFAVEGTYYTAEPGTYFLFFPSDVHRPNIKVDGYAIVKKLVIKIAAAE